MKCEKLQPIEYGRIPNVLLMGNGINVSFGGSSWNQVLAGLSTGEFTYDHESISRLPYALQTIVVSSDSVSDGLREVSKGLMPKPLSEEHGDLLRKYMSIPFDTILTTNYSYEIETALSDGFNLTTGKYSRFRCSTGKGTNLQERLGIYKYIKVNDHLIWHIHGEAARPNSMVMGHYYYGRLLGEIQKRVPEVIRCFKMFQKNKDVYYPKSWIDYFLLGNIHIIGFGLDPSEMDIWWLINCKKRNFQDYGKIYFYEPNLDNPERYALKALTEIFGINCYSPRIRKAEYKRFYYDMVDVMRTSE